VTRPPNGRFALAVGAVLGGIAVAAGAFGAHGLKATLAASGQSDNWETACRYAIYHALAMLATGLLARLPAPAPPALTRAAAMSFCAGTLIFSGCLAALALSGIKILGAIVPIGGVLMLIGWALLAYAATRLTAD
jgi:uncharacterized membrane protein YgdD (TMEM256/DUF423 family)